MLGAARFGNCESTVLTRKARWTYGTRMVTRFDEGNPEHRRRRRHARFMNNTLYLETFRCYVEKGMDLPVGTSRTHTFGPAEEDRNEVWFDVCISQHPEGAIRYLKDEGVDGMVRTLKKLVVDIDRSVPKSERDVSMQLYFGGTDLRIKCERCSDGQELTARTEFAENTEDARYGTVVNGQ